MDETKKISNVIVSIISVILISIGVYCFNGSVDLLVDVGFKALYTMLVPSVYLLIVIELIFLVFKFK